VADLIIDREIKSVGPVKARNLLVSQAIVVWHPRRETLRWTAKLPVGGICVEQKAPSEITQLLQGWREGDSKGLDALLPLVYKELRRLAHFQLRNERADHTLQSGALVHEAVKRS